MVHSLQGTLDKTTGELRETLARLESARRAALRQGPFFVRPRRGRVLLPLLLVAAGIAAVAAAVYACNRWCRDWCGGPVDETDGAAGSRERGEDSIA